MTVDGNSLTATVVDDVTNGTLALDTDGSLTYTPDPGYSGPDSVEYSARDNSSADPPNPTSAAASIDVGARLDPVATRWPSARC